MLCTELTLLAAVYLGRIPVLFIDVSQEENPTVLSVELLFADVDRTHNTLCRAHPANVFWTVGDGF